MMRLTFSFPSTTLLRPVEIMAALPCGFSTAKPPYRVLWALHCAMENGAFFFDRLYAADIVDNEQIVFVAPSLGNGYFVNSPFEAQGDFLQEMLTALRESLPLSRRREDNAVIGVSMGGFGALRWALDSGCFGRIAAISGVFDAHIPPDDRIQKKRVQRALYLSVGKIMQRILLDIEGRTRTEADFERLFQKVKGAFPYVYLYCGEDDYLSLPQTKWLEELGKLYKCPVQRCLSSGEHDLVYWRSIFPRVVHDLLAS